MKSQTYRMSMLFDFYGDTLTARQKEFFDLYHNEDLSLGEIAENHGITRQGVRDVIMRAETALDEMEDKIGAVRRFHSIQEKISQIQLHVEEIVRLNRHYHDNDLAQHAQSILSTVQALQKE